MSLTSKRIVPRGGNGNFVQIVAASNEDGYQTVWVLVAISLEIEKSLFMYLGCFYHMCPGKEYFEILKLKEGRVVHIRNNKANKFHSIGNIRLKMFNDYEFLPINLSYVPELKRNIFP